MRWLEAPAPSRSEVAGAPGPQPETLREPELEITDEFRRALEILHSGGHMFLTGKAGTGKSTLIRHFMEHTTKAVVVAAPTGIAALNVNGYTVHRLFGFRPTTTVEEIVSGSYRPRSLRKVLASLETLIIDEASMVRADTFDMVAAALSRFGPHPRQPFGGVQLVLVGDLFQLPPVVRTDEEEYFRTRYATPYFFSADSFRHDEFPTVSLSRIFRQAGDPMLTAILNAVREGILLKDAQEQLNSRLSADFAPPDHEFWLTLAPTNRIVAARNRRHLEALPGDVVVAVATEFGDLDTYDRPVESELSFKVGAQVMLLNNDPTGRWVNGTIGKITGIQRNTEDAVSSVSILLPDQTTVTVERNTWEVTRPVVEGGVLRHDVVGAFTQFPFKLAWAITIHKSQGQTLDRLVVDFTGGVFAHGQAYVALSRCTSLPGLVLTRPVLTKDLKTDRRILRFLRAATTSPSANRFCAISVLTVGDEGRLSRPRPVEIAVAFDDGTAVSTLINPQRDLGAARDEYNISTQDVLLAPTLREAWATIAPLIEGTIPIGFGTDDALGLIDFELKRLGAVTPLPLGIDVTAESSTGDAHSPRALVRAKAALKAATQGIVDLAGGSPFEEFADDDIPAGFLVTRDAGHPAPTPAERPLLTALVEVSADLSTILLTGAQGGRHHRVEAPDPALQTLIAARLSAAIRNSAGLPAELRNRIGIIESRYNVNVWDLVHREEPSAAASSIDDVLQPGVRVCFTGTVHDPGGIFVSKADLKQLVLRAGLQWSETMTKTRCDALVVAEVGTQSGKARKAKDFGKPVFAAADFFDWLERHR